MIVSKFQEESRFVIVILPRNRLISLGSPEIGAWMCHVVKNNIPSPLSYYDMDLKESILNDMEIVLSPSINETQKILVESLCSKYAPNAIIKDSNLKTTVKLK